MEQVDANSIVDLEGQGGCKMIIERFRREFENLGKGGKIPGHLNSAFMEALSSQNVTPETLLGMLEPHDPRRLRTWLEHLTGKNKRPKKPREKSSEIEPEPTTAKTTVDEFTTALREAAREIGRGIFNFDRFWAVLRDAKARGESGLITSLIEHPDAHPELIKIAKAALSE